MTLKEKFTTPFNDKFVKVDWRNYTKALEVNNAELLGALTYEIQLCNEAKEHCELHQKIYYEGQINRFEQAIKNATS